MSDKADWRYWVAADEIDALNAEIERLRAALEKEIKWHAEAVKWMEKACDRLEWWNTSEQVQMLPSKNRR